MEVEKDTRIQNLENGIKGVRNTTSLIFFLIVLHLLAVDAVTFLALDITRLVQIYSSLVEFNLTENNVSVTCKN